MRAPRLLVALFALAAAGASAQTLRNWFDDPFFQLGAGVAGCPEPAGPRVTEAESLGQSHRRAEKGTTCWLAKEQDCDQASAFAYDRAIAARIRELAAADPRLARDSLWVTVQGRVVYAEGCVVDASEGPRLEAWLRSIPHVQQAMAIVTVEASGKPPYRLFSKGSTD